MTVIQQRRDKRFPLFAHDNFLRRKLSPPGRLLAPFVSAGQVAADLGCGPGFFTLELAGRVGPEGKVYAVDSDVRAVLAVVKKAADRGLRNVKARPCSAASLAFIRAGTVDFVLAHGLLCSMAPAQREAAGLYGRRAERPHGCGTGRRP